MRLGHMQQSLGHTLRLLGHMQRSLGHMRLGHMWLELSWELHRRLSLELQIDTTA